MSLCGVQLCVEEIEEGNMTENGLVTVIAVQTRRSQ